MSASDNLRKIYNILENLLHLRQADAISVQASDTVIESLQTAMRAIILQMPASAGADILGQDEDVVSSSIDEIPNNNDVIMADLTRPTENGKYYYLLFIMISKYLINLL